MNKSTIRILCETTYISNNINNIHCWLIPVSSKNQCIAINALIKMFKIEYKIV
jgi:hypothetical protein